VSLSHGREADPLGTPIPVQSVPAGLRPTRLLVPAVGR